MLWKRKRFGAFFFLYKLVLFNNVNYKIMVDTNSQKIEEIFYEGLTISNPRKSPIHVVALELLALSLLSFMNEVHSLRRVDGEDAFIFRMQLGRKFFVRALVKLDFQSV